MKHQKMKHFWRLRNLRFQKKAQIQMMETIAILFIFFVLVFIGLIFFTRIAKTNAEEKLDKFQELSHIQITQLAAHLPEIQCAKQNIVEENCIDILRLEVASPLMIQNANDYFDLFAFSTVYVEQYYPQQRNWPLYNRPLTNYSNKIATYLPISLFDARSYQYSFGALIVEVYS